MTGIPSKRGVLMWNLCASVGYTSFFFSPLAQEIDSAIVNEAKNLIPGANALDMGAGGGQTSIALLEAGASQIIAVDYADAMIKRIEKRREKVGISPLRLRTVQRDIYDGVIEEVGQEGIDIAIFKRSLYGSREQSLELLSQTFDALRTPGMMIVVHSEESVNKYCANDKQKFVWHHGLKRLTNRLGILLGEYKYYSAEGLDDLCTEATGVRLTKRILSSPAYNFYSMRKE